MSAGPITLPVTAPAKVNIFLEILGKRPDGYHDLRSLVTPVSLCDTLTLEGTDGLIEAVCEADGLPEGGWGALPAPASNLAVKAANLLKEATGYKGGAVIRIRKGIPVGGGMGGGSADAAAALTGLNRLWATGLTSCQLMELGARLGSDVPAMVCGRAVCMEGRGERIRELTCRWPRGTSWWLVLVNPGFCVSTRDIYGRFRTGLTSAEETFRNAVFALEEGDAVLAAASLHNSLEATVFTKYPLLAGLRDRLKAAGAVGVLLSGSGASVFAVAAGHDQALAIEKKVRSDAGSWLWTRVVQVLPDGVMAAHGPLEARV